MNEREEEKVEVRGDKKPIENHACSKTCDGVLYRQFGNCRIQGCRQIASVKVLYRRVI